MVGRRLLIIISFGRMKSKYFFSLIAGFLTLAFLLFSVDSGYSQTGCGKGSFDGVTNKGKEFYIVFMQNEDMATIEDKYQDIFIACDDTATVTITCDEFPNDVDIIPLVIGQGVTVQLSRIHPQNDYLVESSDTISKKAIHVVSTSPIVCYGMNHKEMTADAFLALPINVVELGLTYRVISYPNSHPNGATDTSSTKLSEFAIAAFFDNTIVTITPTADTRGGQMANIPFQVTLNRGECIQFQAAIGGNSSAEDLTGSFILTTNTIAVYGGHQRTEVPTGGVFNSRDHLAESIPPLVTWGKEFIVASFLDIFGTRHTGGLLRIVSGANNNIVTLSPNLTTPSFTLQAGEFRDIFIDPNTIASVRTTQASILGIMANSMSKGAGSVIGDPFLAIVPPVDQLYTDYSYFVSSDPVYFIDSIFTVSPGKLDTIPSSNNYLLVVTEATGVGALVLTDPNNTEIKPAIPEYSKTIQLNGSSYAILRIRQPTPGLWHIRTPNIAQRGINILAYGFGYVDSYGYTAGGLYVPHNGIIEISKDHSLPYPGQPQVPTFTIQNIFADRVYLDSMTISYSANPENIRVTGVGIPLKGGFGEMKPLEEKKITLSPERLPSQPIDGTATIYYRGGLWSDMYPVQLEFHIEPGSMASVSAESSSVTNVAIASNPVHIGSDAVLTVTTSQRGVALINVYDALGRPVMTTIHEPYDTGTHQVRINRKLLTTGAYFYTVTIGNTSRKGQFIVTP